MKEETSYTLEILKEYELLAKQNASQKISFYIKNEPLLAMVPLDQKLHVVIDFLEALFDNSLFKEYLERCDDVIQALFDSVLFPSFKKEIVENLLFFKASSYLGLHDLEKSEQVMIHLVKMSNFQDPKHKGLLIRVFKSKRLLLGFQARGLVIAMILCSAVLSIWTVLFIYPVYPESVLRYQIWTVGVFSLGILIWLVFVLFNSMKSLQEANAFIMKHRKDH